MAIKQIRLRVGPEGTEQLRLLTREIQALATLKVPLTTSVGPTAPPLAGGGDPVFCPINLSCCLCGLSLSPSQHSDRGQWDPRMSPPDNGTARGGGLIQTNGVDTCVGDFLWPLLCFAPAP